MKEWISQLLDCKLVPYIATSEILLPHLDLSIFDGREVVKLLEDPNARNFHEAYLVSNSLGFGNPELKMANWVYIDCVLMQSAVVGFAVKASEAPDTLRSFYEDDPYVDVDTLDYIPVSGQIAALGIDGKTLTGFSLFSLRRQLPNWDLPKLATYTKYAALHVYKAHEKGQFVGLSQYNNKALKTHALFGPKMYIERTIMPLHPLREMSFIYSMQVDFDDERIFGNVEDMQVEDSIEFLLNADDTYQKQELQQRIDAGERFYIAPPIHIKRDNGLYLPIAKE